MARGSGAGARGGTTAPRGGGRSRPGTARIAGIDIQIEDGLENAVTETKPGELFPKRIITPFRPLSKDEKASVRAYLDIRNRIREGPLYTVLGENVRVKRETAFGSETSVVSDPFEHGVETYSRRYNQRKRPLPKMDEGVYSLKFFPRELWGVLDPEYASSGASSRKRNKTLGDRESEEKLKSKLDAVVASEEKAAAAAANGGADGLGVDRGEGSDDDGAGDEAGEGGAGSDVDNEFEEDEDDMVGDYNAEQYFDDGGDDAGDDYDGGDGGGDDGMY